MTIKEAYVTMKVYWDAETCPEREKGLACTIHPRKPNDPNQVREDITKLFDHSTVFKAFVTSVGGISEK